MTTAATPSGSPSGSRVLVPADPAYPRDLIGYGRHRPDPQWPGGAKVAVQFVLNYEEGAENSVLDGDPGSETFLSEMAGPASFAARHQSIETLYEYGSRVGVWRVLRIFEKRGLPLTIFGVAKALQRNPEVTAAFVELGHEIASHGLRWISYQSVDEATERAHLEEAVGIITELTGSAPQGWYTGRDSPVTRRLVVEHGGFLYDSDSYADDLPYWVSVPTGGDDGTTDDVAHLVVPYTLDTNDMRFSSSQGFATGEDFYDHVAAAFDTLYAEGVEGRASMLSIGLHCRLIGRPARSGALERLLDHIGSHDDVWVTRRVDIARHWAQTYPARP